MKIISSINSSNEFNSSDVNMDDTQMQRLGYIHHPIGFIVITIVGLAVWLLGHRLIKVIVIVAAFIFSGWTFFSLAPHIIHLEVCCGKGTSVEVRIAVSIIAALMAGAIACYVYKLGVFCLGCCLGLILSVAVTALLLTKKIHSPLVYYSIYGGSAFVTGVLAVLFEKLFVILATSVVGSLGILYGVDFLAKTPFTRVMLHAGLILKGGLYEAVNDPADFHLQGFKKILSDKTIAMFLGWLLMTIVGCVIQYVYTSQEINGKLMFKSCGGQQQNPCDSDDEPSPQYVLLQPLPIQTQLHQYGRAQRIRKFMQ